MLIVTETMTSDRIKWGGKEYIWPILTNLLRSHSWTKAFLLLLLLLVFYCMVYMSQALVSAL